MYHSNMHSQIPFFFLHYLYHYEGKRTQLMSINSLQCSILLRDICCRANEMPVDCLWLLTSSENLGNPYKTNVLQNSIIKQKKQLNLLTWNSEWSLNHSVKLNPFCGWFVRNANRNNHLKLSCVWRGCSPNGTLNTRLNRQRRAQQRNRSWETGLYFHDRPGGALVSLNVDTQCIHFKIFAAQ